jgi:hypothetical protein
MLSKRLLISDYSEAGIDLFIRSVSLIFLLKLIFTYEINNQFHSLKLAHNCIFNGLFSDPNYYFAFCSVASVVSLFMLLMPGNLFVSFPFVISVLIFLSHSLNFGNGSDYLLGSFSASILIINFFRFWKSSFTRITGHVFIRLFLILFIIQLGFIYLYSGLDKLLTPEWRDGQAFYGILSNEFYLIPSLNFQYPRWLIIIISWVVILFETFFIFLIWVTSVRGFLLIIGTIFHLIIAFALSIPDLGLLMLGGYFLIIAIFPDDLASVRNKFSKTYKWLHF